MRNVGRAVEKLANTVATVRSDDAAVLCLGVLLDDVAELADQDTGLDSLDGLVKTLTRCLYHTHTVGVRLGLVADIVRLVEVGMVTLVVERNVDVEDVAIKQNSLIRNAVADDLVNRCAARLGEVVVVQRRRIRLWSSVRSAGCNG